MCQHLLNIHFYFSLSLVVTSIYYRSSPLFCHDVEWNKQLPQAFFIGETVYFSHYHQPFRELPCWFSLIPLFFCLSPPPTLTYPPDCDFQTPLHVLFVCAFICSHSSLPPRLKAFCLLFMVSLWRRPPPEKETRKGNERRKAVSFMCLWPVRYVKSLFSVLSDAACWTRDWFIVLFACCPGAAVGDLTEMVRIYAQVNYVLTTGCLWRCFCLLLFAQFTLSTSILFELCVNCLYRYLHFM